MTNITSEQPEAGFQKPSPEELKERVINIIADKGCVEIETVTPAASFKDLGFDSLDFVELSMEFENSFAIHISDTDMEKIITVQDAIEFVVSHV